MGLLIIANLCKTVTICQILDACSLKIDEGHRFSGELRDILKQ